jgi:hypothetical protein
MGRRLDTMHLIEEQVHVKLYLSLLRLPVPIVPCSFNMVADRDDIKISKELTVHLGTLGVKLGRSSSRFEELLSNGAHLHISINSQGVQL